MSKPKYDSTIARMAGNIAVGLATMANTDAPGYPEQVARVAVAVARAIVAEVQRTEPVETETSMALTTLPKNAARCELIVHYPNGGMSVCPYARGHLGPCEELQ